MKLIRYDDSKLGVLTDDETGVVDLTDRLGLTERDPLIEYAREGHDATPYLDESPDVDLDDVDLDSPVRRPAKLVCAGGNYWEHQVEMIDTYDEVEGEKSYDEVEWTVADLGYFLKAPSSIVGPGDTVRIPFSDRRVDHEVELAFVMGEDVRNGSAEDVLDSVLGYTILLDISLRGDEDRSCRKSFDTFTVVGPCVATPDEVGDPDDLDLSLAVNGETRQDSNTSDMIFGCGAFAEAASRGTTLEAGDVLTTGTPPGVAQLRDGDVLDARVENVGEMSVDVVVEDQPFPEVTP